MKFKTLVKLIGILIISSLIFLVAYFFDDDKAGHEESISLNQKELSVITQKEMFYDEMNFKEAVRLADEVKSQDNIRAIIVPHHLLVSEYIAKMIKLASGNQQISQVIIIGPNHFDLGYDHLATVMADWQTSLGLVKADQDLTGNLINQFSLTSDDILFDNEHAIGAILPFVKYYFSDAEIVPIALSARFNMNDVTAVRDWISQNLSDDVLVIYSIDFSHYLTKEEADKRDVITRELIEKRDLESIMRLTNDNVDSPATLALALMLADEQGWETEIVEQGNSFDFLSEKPGETTSYFAIAFTE